MRVPLSWLRQYVDLPADAQQVAGMLAEIGFPVDALEERPAITGVVLGRITALAKHPNADRLQVGTIDVGTASLTIATAATNVAAGQTIAVATIGAQLPQMRIERRKMRGVESEGMMISAEELALPAEWFEDGILQMDGSVPVGADAIEYFGLNEPVLDVDVTSNRVDAMCITGLARELAAYQGTALRVPPAGEAQTNAYNGERAPSVDIATPDCRRFVAQLVTGVRGLQSPAWMRIRLALAGQRPIGALVDISNYVMLEMGQPLHFYDADRLAGRQLVVRDARDGETLTTLDGQTHELNARDLVIADAQAVQGLAGLMGGEAAEVRDATSAIVIESANFTGARVRRMSARLGFRSEASTRHEKMVPLSFCDAGAARAADLLVTLGATAFDPIAAGDEPRAPEAIPFDTRDVARLLGFSATDMEIVEYLSRLGFGVQPEGGCTLLVTPPPWRRDVSSGADLVEEVARMAGYDRIEAAIPNVAPHAIPSHDYHVEERLAQTLRALGYREVMNYALHGKSVLDKLAQSGTAPSSQPVEVRNPLSEDQRYLRYALGPGLLEYFARVDRPMRVFEIGHVFYQEDRQPLEAPTLAFGFTIEPPDEPEWRDTPLLQLKSDCEALIRAITGRSDIESVSDERNGLHPGKTAVLLLGNREIANVGRLDPRVQRAFGVRLPVYFASLYLDNVPEAATPRYHAPSKYPSTYRDLAVVCEDTVPAASVERALAEGAGDLCTGVQAFDEYRGGQVAPGHKSLAVRMTLQRFDRTITDGDADEAVARALDVLRERIGATLRT